MPQRWNWLSISPSHPEPGKTFFKSLPLQNCFVISYKNNLWTARNSVGSSQKYHLVFIRKWKPWRVMMIGGDWHTQIVMRLSHFITIFSLDLIGLDSIFPSPPGAPYVYFCGYIQDSLRVVTVFLWPVLAQLQTFWRTGERSRRSTITAAQTSLGFIGNWSNKSPYGIHQKAPKELRLWQTRFSGLIPRFNILGLILNIIFERSGITWSKPTQQRVVVAASCRGGVFQWIRLEEWSHLKERTYKIQKYPQ